MTNAEEEGAPYWKGYLADMAILCGKTCEEMETMALEIRSQVVQFPNDSGWVVNGRIVAPAAVDPYLRMKPIAHSIFSNLGMYTNLGERNRILELLYKYNYLKSGISFQ